MTQGLQFIGKPFAGWLLFLLLAGIGLAEGAKISYPPVPDWVRETGWTAATNGIANAKSSGTRYLLYESQDRPKKAEEFVRVVELMENDNGVQDSGSLRLGFDAEYQELCLHRVVIHRGGKTIGRLNPAQVRLIQPEPGLGGHMLTGRQTAVLFVEDLRVGDALEYAYTIRGANPVLQGHYSSSFTIQSYNTVDREVFRVVWDDQTPLHHRLHLTDAQPVIQPWGGGSEYVWSYTNLVPVLYEDDQPASFEPYPYVEVSDFPDWQSVVNWALPLYDGHPTNIPPELQQLIAKWRSSAHADEEKARWALQFVQDDLRYTAIELGPDSYRPADPVETFQKRYGDCKGKSALLCFLLRQMDLEACPALVNSSDHEAIQNRLPSPFAFNHVIVQIKLQNRTLWVDPTQSHQGGLVWHRHVSPFGKALVIRPENGGLEDVPGDGPDTAWRQKVTSTFDIKTYQSPVTLKIRTEYRGASADVMRDELASTDPNDLAKNYLNYYLRFYPGITSGSPPKSTDDRTANLVTVDESYVMTNLWQREGPEKLWKATFYADNLNNVLSDPETRVRKTPLALEYPMIRHHEVIVRLPDLDWKIPDLATNIETDAFSFNYHRHLAGSAATFTYECRTKAAVVPAAAVSTYLAQRSKMEDLLSDTLQRPDEQLGGINWLMVVIGLFGIGATALACGWYWRRFVHPGEIPPLIVPGPLQGLGGWLILVGINLCAAPLVRVVAFGRHWESYFTADVWQLVAMPHGESYHPLYAPLLMFELLGNIFFLGMNILALRLFFGKRSAFPRLFITFVLSLFVFVVLDEIGCRFIPSLGAEGKNHTEAIRTGFYALIWTWYMLQSRRVKATFVR